MTWATFYLICFVVGFALSVMSFLSGAGKLHSASRLHLPRGLFHHGGPLQHAGFGHAGMGHGGGGTISGGHAPGVGGKVQGRGSHASFFDFTTMMAFLSWFGGTGYLLTRYTSLWAALALGIASVSGLVGAGLVFLFLVKVLLAHEAVLDPADYDVVGALARVNSSIQAGGTGEIIFSLAGTRHTCGARGEDGSAIGRGAEVVITRYEGGIAYVRSFEDLANETGSK
ncbi:MAG: hypothetical protein ACRD3T_20360 [Terriglobia bacterium]